MKFNEDWMQNFENSSDTGNNFNNLNILMALKRPVSVMILKLKLIYDRLSVGQSFLVSGSYLEPITRFLFSV
jgi:hypothetical protein